MVNIKYKYLIIIAVVIIGLFAGNHYLQKSRYNDLVDEVKEDLQEEMDIITVRKDSIVKSRDLKIENLIKENEKAEQKSQYWYSKARSKSVNPSYDLDFLTAADIIANSKYRPGETNGNVRQGGDN